MCISLWTHIGKILWPLLPCVNTLFPHLVQCEAWAIHADKQELSKNTRQESQSTPVRAIHSIAKFQNLNLCLRRLKTTLTLATCHNNIFDHFHSHHRNQSLLFSHRNQWLLWPWIQHWLLVCSKESAVVHRNIPKRYGCFNPSDWECFNPGSSPPKKAEHLHSFLPRLHHKMESLSFWTHDMRNSTIFQKVRHLQTRPQTTIPIVDMFIVRTATTIPFTTPPTSQVTKAAFLAKHCLRKAMRGANTPTRSSHQTGKKLWKETKST